jgi:hypothetical protein
MSTEAVPRSGPIRAPETLAPHHRVVARISPLSSSRKLITRTSGFSAVPGQARTVDVRRPISNMRQGPDSLA